jgi:DNA polymerase-3 subunit epsilon
MNFTAIDFETANPNYASACAVGLTKVRNGKVTKSSHWLMKPSPGVDHFGEHNIRIHKIQPKDVESAVGWSPSLNAILDFAGNDPLVAYNASFGRGVLKAASAYIGIPVPPLMFFCAQKLSQAHLELASYELPYVASALELADFEHHHAGADAEKCASVVLEIAKRRGVGSHEVLWAKSREPRLALLGRAATSLTKPPSQWEKKLRLDELPQPEIDADPTNPLFRKVITFTGDIEGFSRYQAQVHAAANGAINANDITKKTNILVVGSKGASLPKQQKARSSASTGQDILLVSEAEFLRMIHPSPVAN